MAEVHWPPGHASQVRLFTGEKEPAAQYCGEAEPGGTGPGDQHVDLVREWLMQAAVAPERLSHLRIHYQRALLAWVRGEHPLLLARGAAEAALLASSPLFPVEVARLVGEYFTCL